MMPGYLYKQNRVSEKYKKYRKSGFFDRFLFKPFDFRDVASNGANAIYCNTQLKVLQKNSCPGGSPHRIDGGRIV